MRYNYESSYNFTIVGSYIHDLFKKENFAGAGVTPEMRVE